MKVGDILVNVSTHHHDEIMIVLTDSDEENKRSVYYILAPNRPNSTRYKSYLVLRFYNSTLASSYVKVVE